MNAEKLCNVVLAIASVITAWATFSSQRHQKAQTRAKVQFSLRRDGHRIIPELQNSGSEIAREIRVETNPPLVVAKDIDKYYKGYRDVVHCQLTRNVIHSLLPGQTITSEPFPADAFRNQFTGFNHIDVSVSYLSGDGNKRYADSWPIDIALLIYRETSANDESLASEEPGYISKSRDVPANQKGNSLT